MDASAITALAAMSGAASYLVLLFAALLTERIWFTV
jgi:hypothetical protein